MRSGTLERCQKFARDRNSVFNLHLFVQTTARKYAGGLRTNDILRRILSRLESELDMYTPV